MRLVAVVGFCVLAVGLTARSGFWAIVGTLLLCCAFGLIWPDVPTTDNRTKPRSRRKRWLA